MEVRIFFAGDFFSPTVFSSNEGFIGVQPYLQGADYAVVNFEAPVVDACLPKAIQKTGPCLRMPSQNIKILKNAKFGLIALANNHFRDYGDEGCIATLNACRENLVDYVGGGRDIHEALDVFYKNINGCLFAFINVCESEFSIATEIRPGSAPIDESLYSRVAKAKERATYLIVIIHGGKEHYPLPPPRLKRLAYALVDLGSDAVIMHHAHCFCGYEVYNKAPIFYGLGNFFFPSTRKMPDFWYQGCAVTLTFSNGDVGYTLHPYKQDVSGCGRVEPLTDGEMQEFLSLCDRLSTKIRSYDALVSSFEAHDCSLFPFEPYPNWKVFRFLYRNRLIPSLLSSSRKRLILNLIRCETHRDSLISTLSQEEV